MEAAATHCALPQHQTRSLFLGEEDCDQILDIQKYKTHEINKVVQHVYHDTLFITSSYT